MVEIYRGNAVEIDVDAVCDGKDVLTNRHANTTIPESKAFMVNVVKKGGM
jgi:hypothetical protein